MAPDIFETLDLASSSDLAAYNPQHIVNAANALIPLGKEEALAAITGYYRVADLNLDLRFGLFWILRVLFEVPADPGHHPPIHLGVSSPPAPQDLKKIPRFPILLIEDVPILMVMSYLLGGLPESVEAHLEHFATGGVMRTTPLQPGIDARNAGDVDRILAAYKARYRDAYGKKPLKVEVKFIRSQLERMTHPGVQTMGSGQHE